MAFCVVSTLWCNVGAFAAPPEKDRVARAQSHVDMGDSLFEGGRFDQAIAEYTAALALAPHPDLLWNIGRAHEQKKRFAQAIYFFEQYLTLEITADDAALARGRIKSLRPKAIASERGTVVVLTGLANCNVEVGGIKVGTGREVSAEVKTGRYRVFVSCNGMKPFQKVVRITAGQLTKLEVMPEPLVPPCTLLVRNKEKTSLFIGSSETPLSFPYSVQAGRQTIRVQSPRRLGTSIEVECKGGEQLNLDIDLGPIRHPEAYENWAGEYRVRRRADGSEGAEIDHGLLSLGKDGRGRLVQNGERTLETWRANNCGGSKSLRWTREWDATYDGTTLALGDGRITSCSCESYCRVSPALEFNVPSLPRFEGMLSSNLFIVRTALPGAGADSHESSLLELVDEWVGAQWSSDGSAVSFTISEDLSATLRVTRTGMIPSYKRSKCKGAAEFRQRIEYSGTISREKATLVWSPAAPVELDCSCPGACGSKPLERKRTLYLLPFTRYLVGDGVLLWRPWERRDSPSQL